jgi:putative ABC transport system permease protein
MEAIMLKLVNIVKDYYLGENTTVNALRGLTLDFRKSEFVSVLGPSGCGKTTLMNIIGGLDRATSGAISFNGKSTSDFKNRDWDDYRNKKIGFIFQNYYLIPHLSILSNVELALTISGVSRAERTERAKAALIEVGLADQITKRPNQLSGGQMQRVAIARALINNPEILLADEPTGALDTTTSTSIMELIKKISTERLVIMVTHNADLAAEYSTRIIHMLDGKIIDDSDPYDSSADVKHLERVELLKAEDTISCATKKAFKKSEHKSSMSFFTALLLSLRNLLTKKGRTIITSIAGSIGIIGVSLILAVSQGMNNYINKIQSDMMSSYPITITAQSISAEQMIAMINSRFNSDLEKFPGIDVQKLYARKATNTSHKNIITQDYIDYITNPNILNPDLYNDILFDTGMNMNIYGTINGTTDYKKISSQYFAQMISLDFLKTQYDVISTDGHMPNNLNEAVLVVNEYNEVSERALYDLGFISASSEDTTAKVEVPFSEIVGHEFKFASNDANYKFIDNRFIENTPLDIAFTDSNSITLKIVGIVRINASTDAGTLSATIGYLPALKSHMLNMNENSEIVQWMNTTGNELINPYNGTTYTDSLVSTAQEQWYSALRTLGGVSLANSISIYPKSFETKNQIKAVLDTYNNNKEDKDVVQYTDLSETMITLISQLINIITYVLVAFTAISLVVSSVMISIITYVSVIERTKEIGILRSIGARKRDITRVFIAETFIIGFAAGVLGVAFAYIISIPINFIIKGLTEISGIAALSPVSAILMIGISIFLMVIAGLTPALHASRKDPVAALRTE